MPAIEECETLGDQSSTATAINSAGTVQSPIWEHAARGCSYMLYFFIIHSRCLFLTSNSPPSPASSRRSPLSNRRRGVTRNLPAKTQAVILLQRRLEILMQTGARLQAR